ncbi:MAG: AAA family ATPase [Bacteroidales bacterium]|nr:AAA family ATPase [Bacteroidales bacterium]
MTNPFSTGQGGAFFETSVQTAYALNFIINGKIPFLPEGQIEWIKLQGRNDCFQTDDFILCLKSEEKEYKLLAQIKRDISINSNTEEFNKVIKEFWTDFNNPKVFNKQNDIIVLIKGGLLKNDKNLKTVLDWAKTTSDYKEFHKKLDTGKQKVYNEFKTALNIAYESTLKGEQIWEFLRKVYVLSYDFDFAEQSQYQFEVESLIRITKSSHTEKTAKEIWSVIHKFIETRNFTGSRITKEILKEQDFWEYFNPDNLIVTNKAIAKLKDNTQISFKSISDQIGNKKHLERKKLNDNFSECLYQTHFTIITGEAGVGKTAFTKNILNNISEKETNIIAFKAEQFAKSQLSETFSSVGINDNLQDIFSNFSLLPSRIIFVDDIHKLNGIELDNAFRELLTLITENKNIYFVATCRTYAYENTLRKYSKWFADIVPFNIPMLSEDELKEVSETFPDFKVLIDNEKLSKLLAIPKYLDYAIKSKITDNQKTISILEFKDIIWDAIINSPDSNETHIQKQRARLFERVSVERARNLSLFVNVDDGDLEIAEKLKEENVLKEYNDKFAPSHDTLEDIALERYINKNYIDNKFDIPKFFNQIGSEPAIYRAFYLWCIQILNEDNNNFNGFILDIIDNSQIGNFWKDELIHAILVSDYSNTFFEQNRELLLKNNAKIFNRIYKVLNTSCRKYDTRLKNQYHNPYAFIPTGIGWSVITNFVVDYIKEIKLTNNQIITLFEDWNTSVKNIKQHELLAKKIGNVIFTIIQNQQKSYGEEDLIKTALKVILRLSSYFKPEIELLFNETIEYIEDRRVKHTYHSDVYDKFSDIILSGFDSFAACLFFPSLVCELAKVTWYDTRKEINHFAGDLVLPNQERLRNFGLKSHIHNAFPASANKTPILYLLNYHHEIALQFIVELINYSTDVFNHSDFNKEDERIEISIELHKGKTLKQIGALTLWCMYRGTYVATPYTLQSVLMALESWMLSLADTDDNKKLESAFNYLMNNTNSVAITSVIISVATAYPIAFGDKILPLLRVKEFYSWDVNRSSRENDAKRLNNNYFDKPIEQKERSNSNNLSHRNQTIKNIVLYLSTTIYKKQIFELIDELSKNVKKEELAWRKTLNEIDLRNWGITKELENGFEIAPVKVDKDIIEWQKEGEKDVEHFTNKTKLHLWTSKVFDDENTKENTLEEWNSFYNMQKSLISNRSDEIKFSFSEKDLINNKLITLAAIGVRDYYDKLSEVQIEWCNKLVLDSIIETLQYRFQPYSQKSTNVTMVLPFILKRAIKKEEEDDIKKLILATLTIVDEETKKHSIEGVNRYLWTIDTEFAETCCKAILEYNKLKEELSLHFRMLHSDEENKHIDIIQNKQIAFIDEIIEKAKKFNIKKIAYDEKSKYGIIYSLSLIPFNTTNEFAIQLYNEVIEFIIEPKIEKEKDKWNNNKNHHFLSDFQQLLANFLLGQSIENSELLFKKLLSGIKKSLDALKKATNKNKIHEYVNNVQETVEKTLFHMQYIVSPKFGEKNFWHLWLILAQELKLLEIFSGKKVNYLFFDLKYENQNWLELSTKQEFIKQIIQDFAHSEDGFYSCMKLLSGIGSVFSPNSLHWIWEHLSNDSENKLLENKNTVYYLGKYIQDLINNYIQHIRSNKAYRTICFSIIDKMLDTGSNNAYQLRQQIITN